jgi:hypothetical protein
MGDCNCDGMDDKDQRNVTSLPGPGGYVTVWNMSCIQNFNVMTFTESELPQEDPGKFYPFGLIGFSLCNDDSATLPIDDMNLCDGPPCSMADVKITFHGATDLSGGEFMYKRFGPTTPGMPATTTFYMMPGVTFVGNMALFKLTDGMALSDDSVVNGIIDDQGGPATENPPTPVPAVSDWRWVVLLGVLMLTGLFAIRRLRVKLPNFSLFSW